MERLLVSENGRDLDRGMTHFERAVGLAGGGVNVLVDNRQPDRDPEYRYCAIEF